MIAQQLAGSKVPCEKACPEGSTALSLPACRAQTSGSLLPSGLPPGHLGLTPLHSPSTAPEQRKVGPRAPGSRAPPHSRDGEGWAAVPVAHRSQLSHGCKHQAARKTVTSDVPERRRRVLGSVS